MGLHGGAANPQDYHLCGILADYLTRRSIAVLRSNDRGVGKSGSYYQRAITAGLVRDAQAAKVFLVTRPLIEP